MKKIIFILSLVTIMYSQNIIPNQFSILNHTQIFFKWPQISHSVSYQIKIYNNEDTYISYSNKNSVILDNFNWDRLYFWEVCGFDEFENMIDCSEQFTFTISPLPNNYPDTINILANDSLQYKLGITVVDYENLGFSVALNQLGAPVWFANPNNFDNTKIWASEFLSNGNILGFSPGKGYEFDLNSNIIFETPDNFPMHHWIHKTKNDSYFFINAETQFKNCPIECSDDMPSIIPWQGDKFIEIDKDGNILWEWSSFDYIDENEYDPIWVEAYVSSWNFGGSPSFDWTHSNSIFYDDIDDIVYVSIRNLSRIIAIDYSSKEILWNLGNSNFMNEIFFEDDFDFSHQHSVQKTLNNSLIFFDNGRNHIPELSRCVEIEFINNTPEISWDYMLPDTMLTLSRGECDRLSNSNTLITAGRTGNILEINSQNEIIWHLNAKNNNLPVPMYRSQRIDNLFPNSYSFIIDNLFGSYGAYHISDNSENINFMIYNQGWSEQKFTYQLINDSNLILYENEVYIDAYDQENIIINLNSPLLNDYTLKVFNSENDIIQNFQIIEFGTDFVLGDTNDDLLVNILDLTNIINVILFDELYNYKFDIRFDGGINISDIIYLINIILNN
jgi:hypothetical protein